MASDTATCCLEDPDPTLTHPDPNPTYANPPPTSARTPTQVRISKADCEPIQALKLRLREGEGEWRTAYEGPTPGAESWHGAGAR